MKKKHLRQQIATQEAQARVQAGDYERLLNYVARPFVDELNDFEELLFAETLKATKSKKTALEAVLVIRGVRLKPADASTNHPSVTE